MLSDRVSVRVIGRRAVEVFDLVVLSLKEFEKRSLRACGGTMWRYVTYRVVKVRRRWVLISDRAQRRVRQRNATFGEVPNGRCRNTVQVCEGLLLTCEDPTYM